MGIIEIILIGVSIAMDAFAVSICKGLSIKNIRLKNILKISIYFSVFQALMPIIGYFIGTKFNYIVETITHWISFILLSIIGFNMVRDSFSEEHEKINDDISAKIMILLSVATSIDALAIGITFAFFDVNIIMASIIIGLITLVLCFIGVIIGNKFGNKFQNNAQRFGGLILMLIGFKLLN